MSAAAPVSGIVGDAKNWPLEALKSAQAARSAWRSQALSDLVRDASTTWNKLLFPTPRMESWRYTNPDVVERGSFAIVAAATGGIASTLSASDLKPFLIPGLKAHNLVWVDGCFQPSLSSSEAIQGVTIRRLGELALEADTDGVSTFGWSDIHKEESFAALATALMTDGVSISVNRGAVVEKPIQILHIATASSIGKVVTPRLAIEAGEASQVSVIESHVSLNGGSYISLPVAEIRAADGAIVDYVRFQDESLEGYHIAGTAISQGRNAQVRSQIFSFGGALVRNNVTVALNGCGTNAVLNGLSVLSGSQHVDNTTLIHHIEPSAESREHFKGIYADKSKGVFSGTITVEKIAQKTNAFQSNQALLLSPTASIETRPQLKIWADDVKCTHGATVGQLDADALFYLRSRGIAKDTARNFLIHAFASEVVTSVTNPLVREYIEARLSKSLDAIASV